MEPLGGLEELSSERRVPTVAGRVTGYLAAAGAARPARAAHRHARRVPAHPSRAGRPGADHARRARAARARSQRVRHQLGLDRSLARAVRLVPRRARPAATSARRSTCSGRCSDIIGPRIGPSIFLLVYGTVISLLVAVPLGDLLGALPQPAGRPRHPRRRDGRPRDAVVLVRAPARRGVQPPPRPAAGLGLRHRLLRPSREPDPARDHGRHLPGAADHPHAALEPDRDARRPTSSPRRAREASARRA